MRRNFKISKLVLFCFFFKQEVKKRKLTHFVFRHFIYTTEISLVTLITKTLTRHGLIAFLKWILQTLIADRLLLNTQ